MLFASRLTPLALALTLTGYREAVIRLSGPGNRLTNAEEMFGLTSWVQVMVGQGLVPSGYHPLVDSVADAELAQLGESVRQVVASCVAAMPSHEQFIDRYCRAPVAA